MSPDVNRETVQWDYKQQIHTWLYMLWPTSVHHRHSWSQSRMDAPPHFPGKSSLHVPVKGNVMVTVSQCYYELCVFTYIDTICSLHMIICSGAFCSLVQLQVQCQGLINGIDDNFDFRIATSLWDKYIHKKENTPNRHEISIYWGEMTDNKYSYAIRLAILTLRVPLEPCTILGYTVS